MTLINGPLVREEQALPNGNLHQNPSGWITLYEWMWRNPRANDDLDKNPHRFLNNQELLVDSTGFLTLSGPHEEFSIASGLQVYSSQNDLYTDIDLYKPHLITGFDFFFDRNPNDWGSQLSFSDPHMEVLGGIRLRNIKRMEGGLISPDTGQATQWVYVRFNTPIIVDYIRLRYAGSSDFQGRNFMPQAGAFRGYPLDSVPVQPPRGAKPARKTWGQFYGSNAIIHSSGIVSSTYMDVCRNWRHFTFDLHIFGGEQSMKYDGQSTFMPQSSYGAAYRHVDVKQPGVQKYPDRLFKFNPSWGQGGFNYDQYLTDIKLQGGKNYIALARNFRTTNLQQLPEYSVDSMDNNGGNVRLILDAAHGDVSSEFNHTRPIRVDSSSLEDSFLVISSDFNAGQTRITIDEPSIATETGSCANLPAVPEFQQALDEGGDPEDPFSWFELAEAGYQVTARWGSVNTMPDSLIKVDTSDNAIVKGLNCADGIGPGNEDNKYWSNGDFEQFVYLTPKGMAAKLLAFTDGVGGRMGPGHGCRNADPNMTICWPGLAEVQWDYWLLVREELIGICSRLGLDWNNYLTNIIVEVHGYPNENGNQRAGGKGTYPEDTAIDLFDKVERGVKIMRHYFPADECELVISEWGYDKVIEGTQVPGSGIAVPNLPSDGFEEVSVNYDRSEVSHAKNDIRMGYLLWLLGIDGSWRFTHANPTRTNGAAWDTRFQSSGGIEFNFEASVSFFLYFVQRTMMTHLEDFFIIDYEKYAGSGSRFVLKLSDGTDIAYIVYQGSNADVSEASVQISAEGRLNATLIEFSNGDVDGVSSPLTVSGDQFSVDIEEFPKIIKLS